MQSMTGFGRAEYATENLIARIEIASVNRKQADIVFNLPRELGELEAEMRKLLLSEVSRGRVNVSIRLEPVASSRGQISLDLPRAQALENIFSELSQALGRDIEATPGDFLRAPGIINSDDQGLDPKDAREAILPALKNALEKLTEMRRLEGADLKSDLLGRLDVIASHTKIIGEATGNVVSRQRELLHQRLSEAGLELDLNDERLLKEIAVFAERCDISEETTRLGSHLGRFREYLDSSDAVGRPLDFLCQEINRELNTIGSKANDAGIAQNVVLAKTELEKVREQVQNVE
ncbi:YicC family protein [bacterium]|jgi:uncharacterized protein (TIGR00255 family)|nr:YicC family protein [bacterium]